MVGARIMHTVRTANSACLQRNLFRLLPGFVGQTQKVYFLFCFHLLSHRLVGDVLTDQQYVMMCVCCCCCRCCCYCCCEANLTQSIPSPINENFHEHVLR